MHEGMTAKRSDMCFLPGCDPSGIRKHRLNLTAMRCGAEGGAACVLTPTVQALRMQPRAIIFPYQFLNIIS
jgi:hypothetical protein